MQRILMVLAVSALVLAGILFLNAEDKKREAPAEDIQSVSNEIDAAVRSQVTAFGERLQGVSLLMPKGDLLQALEDEYGEFVAPELIREWQEDPQAALGRSVSSPWPERIEIVEIRSEAGQYVVEGNVIEVTSAEAGSEKEAAAVYPVTLTLEERGGELLIVEAQKGVYSELPKRSTIEGVWECLPHKDTTGPQTLECAFGVALEDGTRYAVDTMLMSVYPVDFSTGTKVRISGIVTPVEQLSSEQRYDIDGIMRATTIETI